MLLIKEVFPISESDVQSPWELYLQQKKERRKEAKLKRGMEGTDKKEIANKESVDSGFDDPFFQHSVTTATAVSGSADLAKAGEK